jgi:hypothetical protein
MNTLRSLCSSAVHTLYSGAKNTVSFLCSDICDDIRSIVQSQEPRSTKCFRAASVAARIIGSIGMTYHGVSGYLSFSKALQEAPLVTFPELSQNTTMAIETLWTNALSAKFHTSTLLPWSGSETCFFNDSRSNQSLQSVRILTREPVVDLIKQTSTTVASSIMDLWLSHFVPSLNSFKKTTLYYIEFLCGKFIRDDIETTTAHLRFDQTTQQALGLIQQLTTGQQPQPSSDP